MASRYTRLFLVAKFYYHDENREFDAGIVHRGKVNPNSDEITVVEAVTIGSKMSRLRTRMTFPLPGA